MQKADSSTKGYDSTSAENLHNDFGHQGRDRVTFLILLEENCHRYLRRKVSTNHRASLMTIQASYPFGLVCMDFLTL